ncbi:MAG TPA: hypothetical protein VM820_03885 [Vicinamibacterales bacterium]|nr:hypothetical protein [Vicinamibacterales bacterium]
MRFLLVSLLACLILPAAGQERPLPDYDAFMAEARQRLQADDVRQSGYVYVETRREQKLDASGRATKETVNVFESYPALPGESRWQRQTVKDGRPLSAAELAKQDRERQEKVMEYARKLEREPDKVRAAEQKKRDEERRETDQAVDDALRIYDIRMVGRESIAGYETIAFTFTPRNNAKPRTSEGKVMRHFAGKAWVSETEYELVRLEAEAIETASFGLGLLARVHKGSKASFERRKVNGEAWLPASATYTASARLFLLKRLRIGGTAEFSDYRKFAVETETKVRTPGGD